MPTTPDDKIGQLATSTARPGRTSVPAHDASSHDDASKKRSSSGAPIEGEPDDTPSPATVVYNPPDADPVCVIWDVDGVLVDNYTPHLESWQKTAEKFGVSYTEEDFQSGFGKTSREHLKENFGASMADEQIVEVENDKESLYREMVAENFPAMPGARELIQALKDADFKIALATSGPAANLMLAVRLMKLQPFLSAVVSGNEVAKGKPDPEIFLKAAKSCGVKPTRCVVVEDSRFGVEAAKAAGMGCLGLLSTGHEAAELEAADRVVESLEGLTADDLRALLPAT
ncbi:HAD family hydrolase [Alienimonas californiensis]|uniref:Phosphorylated carbohydrates phosphatase n=1 Tax=Alienimonas californiensis TaxID=2527989 RepID=A0A517P5J8_9PLAN|nr:HAD family phosphatase [Alienimonas californiensis]QDT14642.1 Phosphorylated carbohydrates phosphatase [Alienimonas californiensis]